MDTSLVRSRSALAWLSAVPPAPADVELSGEVTGTDVVVGFVAVATPAADVFTFGIFVVFCCAVVDIVVVVFVVEFVAIVVVFVVDVVAIVVFRTDGVALSGKVVLFGFRVVTLGLTVVGMIKHSSVRLTSTLFPS